MMVTRKGGKMDRTYSVVQAHIRGEQSLCKVVPIERHLKVQVRCPHWNLQIEQVSKKYNNEYEVHHWSKKKNVKTYLSNKQIL